MYGDGTAVHRLMKLGADQIYGPMAPAWSPDGRLIAYTGECGTKYHHDLCVMNSDGGETRMIAPGPTMTYERPAWSPDGTPAGVRTTHGV